MDLFSIIFDVIEGKNSAFFFTPPIYENSKSFIFKKPAKSIFTRLPTNIRRDINLIQKNIEEGLCGYCLIPYETGYLFEERLERRFPKNYAYPILESQLFDKDNYEEIPSALLSFETTEKYCVDKQVDIINFRHNTTKQKYIEAIQSIKNYISDGDTYQVNFTVKGLFDLSGDLIKLFYNLIYNQSASYIALVNTEGNLLVSISPELFFEISDGMITTKPMKGTIRRGNTNSEDLEIAEALKNDSKNRAENVMIVDLLRNDLGRICEFDSVKVISQFEIEKYETLFQMTSTIRGRLRDDDIYTILKNIYPCGSITGAPKIRTMEIINELETEERGYYTGTIGLFSQDKITMNVPIRTILINKTTLRGEVGIGSGVVWDSVAEEEYEETILKSHFLTNPQEPFELFETMLFDEGEVFLLKLHLQRLKDSSEYFLFNYNEKVIIDNLNLHLAALDKSKKYRIKCSLNKWGNIRLSTNEFLPENRKIKVLVQAEVIHSKNKFRYHKTTIRGCYNELFERAKSLGYDEVLFFNEKDEITEGSISNIFIFKNELWKTPPISSGLLNGCYRKHLLEDKDTTSETIITLEDIKRAENIKMVNSLRKELFVSEISYQGKIIWTEPSEK